MWSLEWTCLPDRVHARDETPATMSHLHDRSVIALAGLVNAIDNHLRWHIRKRCTTSIDRPCQNVLAVLQSVPAKDHADFLWR